MTRAMRRTYYKPSDSEQIRIWKAALALTDKRADRWARALTKAIRMIEDRDVTIIRLRMLREPAPGREWEK